MTPRARQLAHWIAKAMVRLLPRPFLRVIEKEVDSEIWRVEWKKALRKLNRR